MKRSPRSRRAPTGISLRRTGRGWRLSQHGTVLSEVLAEPGPTHSVFDVLAALAGMDPHVRDVALLGFGGGGMVAALRALGCRATIHAVDLDDTGYALLRRHRASWLHPLVWHQADAVGWLENAGLFDLVIDDLSVPKSGDVEKPDATWETLPELVAGHLRPGGRAVFNLLCRRGWSWERCLARVRTARTDVARWVGFRDFENRVVVCDGPVGTSIDTTGQGTRRFGTALRRLLGALGSRQRRRIQVRSLH
ncbi:MAG: hypothetical protein JNL97_02725 [Verrucomicrobiales bacterium]|nr:hypothetical protein [Verrucomicrobiales bacterium]